jgi:hypothetical protein
MQLGDLAIAGSLKQFQANAANVAGTMAVSGSITTLSVGGVSGTLAIAGSVYSMRLGGVRGTVAVGGSITKITTGALSGATILDGTILPADNPLGNTNTSYGPGSIGTMVITGPMYGSNIAVGINPGPDGLYGTADDTSAGGGEIAKITLGDGADSSSYVQAGAFGVVRVRPLQSDQPLVTLANPLSDPNFRIPPSAATS